MKNNLLKIVLQNEAQRLNALEREESRRAVTVYNWELMKNEVEGFVLSEKNYNLLSSQNVSVTTLFREISTTKRTLEALIAEL